MTSNRWAPGLESAIAMAAHSHAGQVDKSGAPYITHPLRMVLRAIERRTFHPDVAVVAALHDVIEDSRASLFGLAALGFSQRVVDAVDALTRRPGEAYDDYVKRAAANPLGRIVKALDLDDNTDPARLSQIPPAQRERLAKKYARAREILTEMGA